MTDEIPNQGTGERGVFKLERKPEAEKVSVNKDLIDKDGERGLWAYNHEKRQVYKVKEPKKIVVNAPYVITDEIPPTESMVHAGREMFTSKAKLMQHYKANGYICTGGERRKPPPQWKPDRDKIVDDMLRAKNDAKYGNVELTEEQKEICLREEREYQAYKKRRRAAGY